MTDDRPPYVRFCVKPQEDREASIRNGFYTTKDVEFALCTPQGSKEVFELPYDTFLERKKRDVQDGRFHPEWLRFIEESYKQWKSGQELPENGYPLKNWPVLSPSQLENLLKLGIRTIEDLAAATEEALYNTGIGARELKQKAELWLKNMTSSQSIQQITALTTQVNDLKEQVDALMKANQDLQRAIGDIQPSAAVQTRASSKRS